MALARSYAALTGASDDRDEITPREVRNGLVHLVSLVLTKTGDGLVDPKLVLAWALNALGAPGAFVGALVPIREAGALLPQGLLATRVQAMRRRRLVWSAGSALQGVAALGLAASLANLSVAAAGWAVLACLTVFSVARAACSVSHKDVLARTLPKTRRGAVTGAAASVASALVLVFAAALAAGFLTLSVVTIAIAIAAGGLGWIVAAAIFTRLDETGDGSSSGEAEASLLGPLRDDPQLRRFIAARALLVATALAPPFLILAAGQEKDGGLGALGPLMIASAAASIVSSWGWGRLSDRSSRLTLALSGALAALVLGLAAAAALATGGLFGLAGTIAAVFVAQTAYEGVRAGRKLHLTDMADDASRARYTAVSNTLIGAVLVLGGSLGLLADLAGPGTVLALLALLAALAVPVALGLEEVQSR